MSSLASNKKYLQSLVDQIKKVPTYAGAELAVSIFIKAVEATHVDSGQAALNWRITAYSGGPDLEQQEMLWGYGNVSPTAPAGYKWSLVPNDSVKASLIQDSIILGIQFKGLDFDGISVYNPITPNFANFSPGSDANYEFNALSDAEAGMSSFISNAMSEMEKRMLEQFSFLSIT